ncbi:hypothetical protein B4U79_00418 [Dinothrombium tinctorium]|uniref:Uncharacterized protein n=1 Tax=Dinothrombium tinctorium TaxID=1965070 RepID=A0A3S3RE14_9ACAR|nr:hypothetical protein B4U79_12066 [Dinothrombium tinctorium]RWR99585.1 hypothetical protein B4U79_10718 [Dinothrombium tinctorium]RWS00212.1 hypothetical protein B4U79_00418 [Dinothrombium tinctorium]
MGRKLFIKKTKM